MRDAKHGSPYDRGAADSYYRRDPIPHLWEFEDGGAIRVEVLTDQEESEYWQGYWDNEDFGNFKEYN